MKLNIFLTLVTLFSCMQIAQGMEGKGNQVARRQKQGNFVHQEISRVPGGFQAVRVEGQETLSRSSKDVTVVEAKDENTAKKALALIDQLRSKKYSLTTKIVAGASCIAVVAGTYYVWKNPEILSNLQGKLGNIWNSITSYFSPKVAAVTNNRYDAYLPKF